MKLMDGPVEAVSAGELLVKICSKLKALKFTICQILGQTHQALRPQIHILPHISESVHQSPRNLLISCHASIDLRLSLYRLYLEDKDQYRRLAPTINSAYL